MNWFYEQQPLENQESYYEPEQDAEETFWQDWGLDDLANVLPRLNPENYLHALPQFSLVQKRLTMLERERAAQNQQAGRKEQETLDSALAAGSENDYESFAPVSDKQWQRLFSGNFDSEPIVFSAGPVDHVRSAFSQIDSWMPVESEAGWTDLPTTPVAEKNIFTLSGNRVSVTTVSTFLTDGDADPTLPSISRWTSGVNSFFDALLPQLTRQETRSTVVLPDTTPIKNTSQTVISGERTLSYNPLAIEALLAELIQTDSHTAKPAYQPVIKTHELAPAANLTITKNEVSPIEAPTRSTPSFWSWFTGQDELPTISRKLTDSGSESSYYTSAMLPAIAKKIDLNNYAVEEESVLPANVVRATSSWFPSWFGGGEEQPTVSRKLSNSVNDNAVYTSGSLPIVTKRIETDTYSADEHSALLPNVVKTSTSSWFSSLFANSEEQPAVTRKLTNAAAENAIYTSTSSPLIARRIESDSYSTEEHSAPLPSVVRATSSWFPSWFGTPEEQPTVTRKLTAASTDTAYFTSAPLPIQTQSGDQSGTITNLIKTASLSNNESSTGGIFNWISEAIEAQAASYKPVTQPKAEIVTNQGWLPVAYSETPVAPNRLTNGTEIETISYKTRTTNSESSSILSWLTGESDPAITEVPNVYKTAAKPIASSGTYSWFNGESEPAVTEVQNVYRTTPKPTTSSSLYSWFTGESETPASDAPVEPKNIVRASSGSILNDVYSAITDYYNVTEKTTAIAPLPRVSSSHTYSEQGELPPAVPIKKQESTTSSWFYTSNAEVPIVEEQSSWIGRTLKMATQGTTANITGELDTEITRTSAKITANEVPVQGDGSWLTRLVRAATESTTGVIGSGYVDNEMARPAKVTYYNSESGSLPPIKKITSDEMYSEVPSSSWVATRETRAGSTSTGLGWLDDLFGQTDRTLAPRKIEYQDAEYSTVRSGSAINGITPAGTLGVGITYAAMEVLNNKKLLSGSIEGHVDGPDSYIPNKIVTPSRQELLQELTGPQELVPNKPVKTESSWWWGNDAVNTMAAPPPKPTSSNFWSRLVDVLPSAETGETSPVPVKPTKPESNWMSRAIDSLVPSDTNSYSEVTPPKPTKLETWLGRLYDQSTVPDTTTTDTPVKPPKQEYSWFGSRPTNEIPAESAARPIKPEYPLNDTNPTLDPGRQFVQIEPNRINPTTTNPNPVPEFTLPTWLTDKTKLIPDQPLVNPDTLVRIIPADRADDRATLPVVHLEVGPEILPVVVKPVVSPLVQAAPPVRTAALPASDDRQDVIATNLNFAKAAVTPQIEVAQAIVPVRFMSTTSSYFRVATPDVLPTHALAGNQPAPGRIVFDPSVHGIGAERALPLNMQFVRSLTDGRQPALLPEGVRALTEGVRPLTDGRVPSEGVRVVVDGRTVMIDGRNVTVDGRVMVTDGRVQTEGVRVVTDGRIEGVRVVGDGTGRAPVYSPIDRTVINQIAGDQAGNGQFTVKGQLPTWVTTRGVPTEVVPGTTQINTQIGAIRGQGIDGRPGFNPIADATAPGVTAKQDFSVGSQQERDRRRRRRFIVQQIRRRRKKTDCLELPGAELVVGAMIIAAAGVRKAEVQQQQAEAGEREKQQASQQFMKNAILIRRTHVVQANENLVELAERLYNDGNIGWLIADINRASIKESHVEGKRVVELRPGQVIDLPDFREIDEFKEQYPKGGFADSLVTIIAESQFTREVLDIALGTVMGAIGEPAHVPV